MGHDVGNVRGPGRKSSPSSATGEELWPEFPLNFPTFHSIKLMSNGKKDG